MTAVMYLRAMVERGGTREETRYDDSPERLRAIVDDHYALMWRWARRLGAPAASTEDVVQKVLLVVSKRLADLEPGSEKAFLYRTTMNVVAHERRSLARRREEPGVELEAIVGGPSPFEVLEAKEARVLLDDALDALADDVRPVFVLYELEELTMAEIAKLLGLASGTVASRLRRAREEFGTAAKRALVRRGERR
ncbi:MAG: sigma-70 family RNA polymerase sigma factor [Polyangiaceae bacterium]